MKIVKGDLKIQGSIFKNHLISVALNMSTDEFYSFVVLNPEDDIRLVSMSPEMSYFIDAWGNGIISFKSDDVRCNNYAYYENMCQNIVSQLMTKIN